jgi:hypothetical protein
MSTLERGTEVVLKGETLVRGIVTEVHAGKLEGMVTVRIWSGLRHVGDVCVGISQVERGN